jgi:hypothetical protein
MGKDELVKHEIYNQVREKARTNVRRKANASLRGRAWLDTMSRVHGPVVIGYWSPVENEITRRVLGVTYDNGE